jgi:hypothetical protein
MNTQNLTPITDDTPNSASGFDAAGAGGFNLSRLMGMLADCDNQPPWRTRADLAAAYVDGKQFTAEQENAARQEGLGDVRPTNLIGRVIRSVCGTEAKARTDVKVEADEDETADVADVLNVKLKEAQRECFADMAVSDAYFGQVGPGVGWVEVARNADPLDYAYRVASIHRSEMWWDFKDPDLLIRGARWVARKRWHDLDELEAAMPKHRTLLRQVSNGAGFTFDNTVDETGIELRQWGDESRWNNFQRRTEWYDGARKRVKLYEVWYKVPAMGIVMDMGPTRKLLFDERNQSHIEAVASGRVRISKQLTRQVRCALFAGPHRLQDVGTTRRNFPYTPFFAYRDDADLSPYGLVEGMISPQDGYNARRLRINWMLRARQIQIDNDALDTKANTLAEIADRVMRPDLVVVLDANRKNQNAFQVMSSLQLQKEQIEVMQDDKQLIQDVPGVYGSQLGQAASGVTSGIANSLLIEQGAVAMGDLNDNYRHSRRMVFENLLDLIVEDHIAPGMQVKIGRGSARRVVQLNVFDPEQGEMVNNVMDAPVRVGLGEVPSTPAYRMQQQQQIGTIIQSLAQTAPAAAAVLAPSFIESTDLPDRMELADDIRRAIGMPTSGDKAAQQEQQAAQKQEAEQAKQLKQQAMQLELAKSAADLEKTKSDTELNKAKVMDLGHKAGVASIQTADAANQADREHQRAAAEADRSHQLAANDQKLAAAGHHLKVAQAATAARPEAQDPDEKIIEQQNALIEEALAEASAA